ncbi:MAG: hypothetical protein ACWGOW_00125 [Gammaproteobacteria bacterium]
MKNINSTTGSKSWIHRRHQPDWILFILGVMTSSVAVYMLSGAYHAGDISIFLEWQKSLHHSLSDIYIDCSLCNYPILGTLFSAGILELLNTPFLNIQPDMHIQYYQYVLAMVDGINVVLVYLILKALSVPRSPLWAGIIGMIPSSWVGGALWGQIDGFSQFFLLAFLLHNLNYLSNHGRTVPQEQSIAASIWYVTGSSILLTCLLLTKQLSIFSLPVLVFMVLNVLYFYDRKHFIPSLTGFITLTIIGTLLPDFFLSLKEGYFSHVQYILFGGGSPHGNKISGNGFNIWMFLDRDMYSSSSRPFLSFLTPKYTGIFLFLFYESVMFLLTLLWLKYLYIKKHPHRDHRKLFLIILYVLALTNLSFNIFLSGTHERYLYHFYPFILIAYLGLHPARRMSEMIILGLILTGSVFYGIFVYEILTKDTNLYLHGLPGLLGIHRFQASFHILLFGLLSIDYIRKLELSMHLKTGSLAMDGGKGNL